MELRRLQRLAIVLSFVLTPCISALATAAANTAFRPDQFLQEWLVLKSIPITGPEGQAPDGAAQSRAFDQDWLTGCGGETNIRPRAGAKAAVASRTLKWRRMASKTAVVDLVPGSAQTENSLAYAWAEIEAPQTTNVFLALGSDDAVKVWLNGKLVHENWTFRPARVDEDVVPVELARGKNQLLLKILNGGGGWGFVCRFLDRETGQAHQLVTENANHPQPDGLTDTEIKTMLRDCVDGDGLGVGMVIGMVDDHGRRIVSYGKKDCRQEDAVDGDTLFEIGSITKVFTRLLLLDMVKRGEMKLDDPVQKYLPASVRMPTRHGKPITLLHLASHTSGLPREAANLAPRTWRVPYADYTVEQLYQFLSSYKLRRDPGAKFAYSNVGVALLGHVIALKAGQDYESLVVERICRPLHMDSTRITLTCELKARLATGYGLPGRPVLSWDSQVLLGNGSLRSTANDMLKFAAAGLGLTPSALTPLMQRWDLGHEGGTLGFSTALVFDKEHKRALVVLANVCNFDLSQFENLLDNQSPRPPRTVPVDCSIYNEYAGEYRAPDGSLVDVRRDGDRLLLPVMGRPRYLPAPSCELFPQSKTVFYNQLFRSAATFVPSANGNPMELSLSDPENKAWHGKKISTNVPPLTVAAKLAPGLYDKYCGRYRFTLGPLHVGPVVRVSHEADALGDHLIIASPAFAELLLGGGEVFAVAERMFIVRAGTILVNFTQNKKGKVTGMAIRLNDSAVRLVKTCNLPGIGR